MKTKTKFKPSLKRSIASFLKKIYNLHKIFFVISNQVSRRAKNTFGLTYFDPLLDVKQQHRERQQNCWPFLKCTADCSRLSKPKKKKP